MVALGDLDSFKRLNDTYGHGAGDVVLRTFAGLLSDSVRQSDLVCRYGGEEFAFLFPESTIDQAHILVERFRQRFAEHDIRLPDAYEQHRARRRQPFAPGNRAAARRLRALRSQAPGPQPRYRRRRGGLTYSPIIGNGLTICRRQPPTVSKAR